MTDELAGVDSAVHVQGESGVRFAELLSLVAAVDPDNMRIRFQSPHPKDFPDEVLTCESGVPCENDVLFGWVLECVADCGLVRYGIQSIERMIK